MNYASHYAISYFPSPFIKASGKNLTMLKNALQTIHTVLNSKKVQIITLQ